LRRGYERFICKPDDLQEHLDALILAANSVNFDWSFAHVVTWRGIMTKLLCSLYLDESWTLHGNIHQNIIFLEERKETRNMRGKLREFMYGGFKFEELCMASINGDPSSMSQRAEQIVNNNSEFDVVLTSSLGGHKLLIGAEVDGLDEIGDKYIELKTTRVVRSENMRTTLEEKKMLKWWTQSFLGGIPTILVGYRNDRGWVERLERLDVGQIPRRLRGRVRWDPQLLLAHGDLILTWLKQMVMSQEQHSTFTLSFDPLVDGGERTIKLEFSGPTFLPKM
jgi:RAT1-interacting protein